MRNALSASALGQLAALLSPMGVSQARVSMMPGRKKQERWFSQVFIHFHSHSWAFTSGLKGSHAVVFSITLERE